MNVRDQGAGSGEFQGVPIADVLKFRKVSRNRIVSREWHRRCGRPGWPPEQL